MLIRRSVRRRRQVQVCEKSQNKFGNVRNSYYLCINKMRGDMDIKSELKAVRETLTDICNKTDEDSPFYNYLMNGLMFVDEAARIANGEGHLNPKWLRHYANKCV